MDTFSKIQDLSDEQQHLWRKAGRGKLAPYQRERLRDLKPILARLWHVYRCELARERTSDPMADTEALYHSPWFADFLDRMKDAVRAQYDDIEDVPYAPQYQPTPRQSFWIDVAEILREAWEEVRQEERHNMTLAEILEQRGLSLRWEGGRAILTTIDTGVKKQPLTEN